MYHFLYMLILLIQFLYTFIFIINSSRFSLFFLLILFRKCCKLYCVFTWISWMCCENNELRCTKPVHNRRWRKSRHIDLRLCIWIGAKWAGNRVEVVVKWYDNLSMDSKRGRTTTYIRKYSIQHEFKTDLISSEASKNLK